VVGIGIVIAIYPAANVAYLRALPMSDVLTSNSTAFPNAASIASRAAVATLGAQASKVLTVAFMISGARRLALPPPGSAPRVLCDGARSQTCRKFWHASTPEAHTLRRHLSSWPPSQPVCRLWQLRSTYQHVEFRLLALLRADAFGLRMQANACPHGPDSPGLPLWIPLIFLLATTAILLTVVVSGLRRSRGVDRLGSRIPVYVGLRWRYWSRPTQGTTAMR